jgi:hypothetical protein
MAGNKPLFPLNISPPQALPWHRPPPAQQQTYEPEPKKTRNNLKCILLTAAISLLLVLTVTAVGLLISYLTPDHPSESALVSSALAISSAASNIHIYYFRFQTGAELQISERHPEFGTMSGLNLTNILDYSVCCTTQSHQFVCMGGSSLTHGGGAALEALLQEQGEEVYLLLWLNSRDLIEVGCVMRASVLAEG